jgi:uncharacterized protein YjbJ (UPF0337 family)
VLTKHRVTPDYPSQYTAGRMLQETYMNWDTAKGNWTLFKGNVKLQWGNLTDDHLSKLAGKRDQLTGKIQKSYAATKQTTEKQMKEFVGPHKDYGPRI